MRNPWNEDDRINYDNFGYDDYDDDDYDSLISACDGCTSKSEVCETCKDNPKFKE